MRCVVIVILFICLILFSSLKKSLFLTCLEILDWWWWSSLAFCLEGNYLLNIQTNTKKFYQIVFRRCEIPSLELELGSCTKILSFLKRKVSYNRFHYRNVLIETSFIATNVPLNLKDNIILNRIMCSINNILLK